MGVTLFSKVVETLFACVRACVRAGCFLLCNHGYAQVDIVTCTLERSPLDSSVIHSAVAIQLWSNDDVSAVTLTLTTSYFKSQRQRDVGVNVFKISYVSQRSDYLSSTKWIKYLGSAGV